MISAHPAARLSPLARLKKNVSLDVAPPVRLGGQGHESEVLRPSRRALAQNLAPPEQGRKAIFSFLFRCLGKSKQAFFFFSKLDHLERNGIWGEDPMCDARAWDAGGQQACFPACFLVKRSPMYQMLESVWERVCLCVQIGVALACPLVRRHVDGGAWRHPPEARRAVLARCFASDLDVGGVR